MNIRDIIDLFIDLFIFVGFGAWWLLAPNSVIRFYTWLTKGKAVLPKPVAIRIMGLVCILGLIGLWTWTSIETSTPRSAG